MLTQYLVAPRDRPYLVLFTARRLEEAAAAVAAQPDPAAVLVYASVDDISRDLNPDERGRLAELLRREGARAVGGPRPESAEVRA